MGAATSMPAFSRIGVSPFLSPATTKRARAESSRREAETPASAAPSLRLSVVSYHREGFEIGRAVDRCREWYEVGGGGEVGPSVIRIFVVSNH